MFLWIPVGVIIFFKEYLDMRKQIRQAATGNLACLMQEITLGNQHDRIVLGDRVQGVDNAG